MEKVKTLNAQRTYLEQLKALAYKLADRLDNAELDDRNMATLAKQYRETIKEIHDIEGETDATDEISEILSERKAVGKPNAVRPLRS